MRGDTRVSRDETFLRIAEVLAERSTCKRRAVGCVLTDEYGIIMATGYNGTPRGYEHCIRRPCEGAMLLSGSGLDLCMATHAEQNALVQCPDVSRIHTCYCTASPCIGCVKMLLNTGCRRVVFREQYPHPDARKLWDALRPSIYNKRPEEMLKDFCDHGEIMARSSWRHMPRAADAQQDVPRGDPEAPSA